MAIVYFLEVETEFFAIFCVKLCRWLTAVVSCVNEERWLKHIGGF